MTDIKTELIKILGEDVYNTHSFVVPENTKKMVKVIDYLFSQIQITKRWCDDDGKEHVDGVIENVKKMLNN
jgi:hypothetical protein